MDLSIKPIDDQRTKNSEPKILPSHPFSMSIVAGKGSGKTTLIANLLMRPEFYRNEFERIVIFCPTLHADEKWERLLKEDILYKKKKKLTDVDPEKDDPDRLKINRGDVHTEPEDFVKELKAIRAEYTEIFKEEGKKALPKTLIILDDCLGLKVLSDKTLVNFIANCRHLNCSVLISVQRYNGINKTIRVNCTYLIVYPLYDEREIKLIYEENGSKLTYREFTETLLELFESPERKFLAINNQNPPSHRLIDTFKYFIMKRK